MVKKLFATIFAAFALATTVRAQAPAPTMQQMEDSLLLTADSMYTAFIPDTRLHYCEQFVRQLVRTLKSPNSYDYPFDKLKEKINIIYPDDKKFRIFNWVIAPSDVTRRYYGAIQMPGEQLKLYPLVDYSKELGKGAEDSVLNNAHWFGALYYRIIAKEVNGEMVYTLFGLNAGNAISNKKLMDPMRLTPSGPVFGMPIFTVMSETNRGQRINRFIIEYKKEVQASMNWDADLGLVYFDKLVSSVNDPNRKYTFVPSGEYDGFKWQNDQWTYVQNLIPPQSFGDGNAPAPEPIKSQE